MLAGIEVGCVGVAPMLAGVEVGCVGVAVGCGPMLTDVGQDLTASL